ncbi:MAG: hypothetical protein K5756_08775 [Clostridiales bacterium]|nr:hypothetical protein [Clostridiales bacterium]
MLQRLLSVILLPVAMLLASVSPPPAVPVRVTLTEDEPVCSAFQTFDSIHGAAESNFYILRPKSDALTAVSTDSFGMNETERDNTRQFMAAIDYCRSHPDTKLVIVPGVYRFTQTYQIIMQGLKNVYIEGEGAKFIFCSPGRMLHVRNCEGLEIHGLAIDYDRANDPIDDVAVVRNADPGTHTLDLCFFEKTDVDESMVFRAATQCDPQSLTFGAPGSEKEVYFYSLEQPIINVAKVSPNVLRVTHSGCMDSFADGETYILRHYVYDGEGIYTENSTHVTYSGMKIYGGTGCFFVFGVGASHFQIIDTTVGVDPRDTTGAHVSTAADAIHIVNTGGRFRVEGCDISRQGDDALNVHDGLGYIDSVEGDTVRMFASAFKLSVGDILRFKDAAFQDIPDFSAVIVGADTSGSLKKVRFDRDVSQVIGKGYIALNTETDSSGYVIRNNYIHENRARGFLLQSSCGLCENNRFYKTQMQAIKIVVDIIPSLWQEGTGVNTLEIRGNTFEQCVVGENSEVITLSTNLNGRSAERYVFENIDIVGNTFTAFPGRLVNASNANGLRFEDNTVKADKAKNALRFGAYCENLMISGNRWQDRGSLIAKFPRCKTFREWVFLYSGEQSVRNAAVNG